MQPQPSLKGRALRWLSQREHTRAELERKLQVWLQRRLALQRQGDPDAAPDAGCGPDAAGADIPALLDELTAKGFLSDDRAAESLLAGRGRRLGPLRLRQELRARGFDAELAGAVVARSRSDELARAAELWRRRFGNVAADARDAARQARFLAARGFSADVVARIVRGAGVEPG